MLKVHIDYPNKAEELEILKRMAYTRTGWDVKAVLTPEDILRLRDVVDKIYLDHRIENYIVNIVDATRNPLDYGLADLKALIQFGASPRATINLTLASRAHAFLQGRGYVSPDDVKAIAPDVLRHRVLLSYEAEAEEKTTDDIISGLMAKIPVP